MSTMDHLRMAWRAFWFDVKFCFWRCCLFLTGRKRCRICYGFGIVERLDSGYMQKFGLRPWNGCEHCGGERERMGSGIEPPNEAHAGPHGTWLFVPLLFLAIPALVLADVEIKPEHRVANRGGGYCLYCGLETLGRHMGNRNLYLSEIDGRPVPLVDWYAQWPSQGAGDAEVRACLDRRKIRYRIYRDRALGWLREKTETKSGKPILIAVHNYSEKARRAGSSHAVVAVGVRPDNYIRTVDPNWTQGIMLYHCDCWYWSLELDPPQ